MKEVKTEFKEKTIAIDFDGVIHRYSKGFQGLHNAYDGPTEGTEDALKTLKAEGYRLIIVSSRPVEAINKWLKQYELDKYFDDVSNTKHPAKYYIDDHAVRFPKGESDPWLDVLTFIDNDVKYGGRKDVPRRPDSGI
jgi:ribonucleotide monophosphatase NagD (HAD superfamily)